MDATKGSLQGVIKLTWGTVSGASNYEVQYRKQGAGTWTSAVGVASGWQLSTTDESVYEFQVRPTNPVGAGPWSDTATGFIRPQIMPQFVSQNAPDDVLAGANFTVTQVWKNIGYTAWNDATYQLVAAPGSSNFGSAPGTFPSSVTQDQSGTSTLSMTAPSSPGTYTLSWQFAKSGTNYGDPSTPVQIKVWGPPVCSALSTDKPYIYNLNGQIVAQFSTDNQTTGMAAKVWNDATDESSAKSYTPAQAGGVYKFTVPMSNHGGQLGTYHLKVSLTNPVTTTNCETTFELRPLSAPVASLQALIGSDGANGFVVGQAAADKIVRASITRTENMAMTVDLLDGEGAVAATSSMAAGAGTVDLAGARWDGDAWSTQSYTIRMRYADPEAASQGLNIEQPITLILSPNGNTLRLEIAPTQPLTVATAMARGAQPYDAVAQGAWTSKVGVQGEADLDAFADMGSGGQRNHALDYNALYGKTLLGTARAVPPAGITLVNPLQITTTAKLPVLPVRNLQATDGTLEDVVRVTWDSPAEGGVGFSYDVYRDEELIQSNKPALTLDDTPPERGKEYTYRVVATLSTDKSGEASDPGHVPACRAARLIGAGLNADMSAITGLIESWSCLEGLQGTHATDAAAPAELGLQGESQYRGFSVPVASELPDGAHVLHLGLESEGVTINASRTYDVPFALNRASIAVKNLSITYNGSPAVEGQNAESIGRFGIKMDGGSGIGFAEEVK